MGNGHRANAQTPPLVYIDENIVPQANTQSTKRSLALRETSNVPTTKRQRSDDILLPCEYNQGLLASDYKTLKQQDHGSKASSMDYEGKPTQQKENSVQVIDLEADNIPLGDSGGENEFDDKELESTLSLSLSNMNPISEPPLCQEQVNIVETIISGRNVFYTGAAGCGKSFVLKCFVKCLKDLGKCVNIVAPTGRAALNVNGSTLYSYAGWTPDKMEKNVDKLFEECKKKRVWRRLNNTDVLVIDEISMVENFFLERLNRIMKKARGKPDAAFGGVQVIVAGDFLQLLLWNLCNFALSAERS